MNENKDIKSQVLEKIRSGKINMRPHFYYVLQVTALIVLSVLILLISSLLVSFIIFSLMVSGKLFLLGFGLRGFLMFFLLFPWFLLVVEIALVILLEWLLKRFKFGYSMSFVRLILGIFLISILISVVIDVTPFHGFLLRRAEQRNLPVFGDYYRGIRRPPPEQEIFRGTVSGVGTSSFVLSQAVDVDDSTSTKSYVVVLPPGTPRFFAPTVDDTVFVAGHLVSTSTVQAYGYQKFSAPDTQ